MDKITLSEKAEKEIVKAAKKERPRYVAGEVVKWGKRYLKRL